MDVLVLDHDPSTSVVHSEVFHLTRRVTGQTVPPPSPLSPGRCSRSLVVYPDPVWRTSGQSSAFFSDRGDFLLCFSKTTADVFPSWHCVNTPERSGSTKDDSSFTPFPSL